MDYNIFILRILLKIFNVVDACDGVEGLRG